MGIGVNIEVLIAEISILNKETKRISHNCDVLLAAMQSQVKLLNILQDEINAIEKRLEEIE